MYDDIIDLIEDLIDEVINSESLDEADQEKLIKKLETAIRFLENDPPQVKAACGKLKAFINQVNAFINAGRIDQSEGEALIVLTEIIRALLKCWQHEK